MKTTKLRLGTLLLGSMVILSSVSCKKEGCTDQVAVNYSATADKEDGSCKYADVNDGSIVYVSTNITSNTTWTKDKIYVLTTRVSVTNGATLTIEPGTVIKGEAGTGANATALIIARGAKINAEGTATEPIIFTSIADEITSGQITSPNMDASMNGLWGGLIVLGNAPISADNASMQIEGIPASDPNGLYGGSNASDNSGVIKYVSIRHGGANIGEGNEINGLTLGGVGNATVVENVEIIGNQDDGIEFFGGTVNVSNLLIWNAGDDCVDADQGWSGTLDNFIVICGTDTDHALEIDGPEGALLAAHVVKNGSIKGSSMAEMGDFRDGVRGAYSNLYFFNFSDPSNGERGDFALSGQVTIDNFTNSILSFENLQVTLPSNVTLTQAFLNGTSVHATNVSLGANSVGANTSPFAGWSWASAAGQLSGF